LAWETFSKDFDWEGEGVIEGDTVEGSRDTEGKVGGVWGDVGGCENDLLGD
jgi:hypothetical protein